MTKQKALNCFRPKQFTELCWTEFVSRLIVSSVLDVPIEILNWNVLLLNILQVNVSTISAQSKLSRIVLFWKGWTWTAIFDKNNLQKMFNIHLTALATKNLEFWIKLVDRIFFVMEMKDGVKAYGLKLSRSIFFPCYFKFNNHSAVSQMYRELKTNMNNWWTRSLLKARLVNWCNGSRTVNITVH